MAHDDQRDLGNQARSLSAVASFALQVVSVLNERQARQQFAARPYISNILDRRITGRGPFDPAELLYELRGFRLNDDEIIDSYIPVAARMVGEKWVADELSFADTTIASSRLQGLLTEIAYNNQPSIPLSLNPLQALIVMPVTEQHTLGGFVAAAQVRRRGASARVLCGEPFEQVEAAIAEMSPDIVMFSTSRRSVLESIAKTTTHLRTRLEEPPLFAVGGIILDLVQDVMQQTGVDLATNDVETVLTYCAQRSGIYPDLVV